MPRAKDPLVFFPVSTILDQPGRAPDEWWAWCRVLALCRRRRACSEKTYPAAIVAVAPRDLCSLMGRARRDHALRVLAAVPAHEELVLTDAAGRQLDATAELARSYRGGSFLLVVSKYAELQRFEIRTGGPTITPLHRNPPTPLREPGPRRTMRTVRRELDTDGQRTIDEWLAGEGKRWMASS